MPSPSSVANLRAGGRWFDPRLGQYSFRGLMIVIATGFIPLSLLSFYHNLEVDKDCLVSQLCLFCIVTSLKILASYTLLPLLMYSCKFQLRNSIFIILYTITCTLNDQSCRCAIKQHSFIHSFIHSSLAAVCCFDSGYLGKQPVAWKKYCA